MRTSDFGFGAPTSCIIYCGPSGSGKTTNLEVLSRMLPPGTSGTLAQLTTDVEPVLAFDHLSIEMNNMPAGPAHARFELFTAPSESNYLTSRKRILGDADGIVFVADSRRDRLEDNIIALGEVAAAMQAAGRDTYAMPVVVQLNRRDDPTALPAQEILAALLCEGEPYVAAVAREGRGVGETIRLITRQVLACRRQAVPIAV